MSYEPKIVIKKALTVDTYELGEQIEDALKNIEFDLIITEFTIVARNKSENEEPE